MSYESRFGGSRFIHDPAATGIFIHRCGRNDFMLTRPLRSPVFGDLTREDGIYPARAPDQPCPTFNSALRLAQAYRAAFDEFTGCGIYLLETIPEADQWGTLLASKVQRVA